MSKCGLECSVEDKGRITVRLNIVLFSDKDSTFLKHS